MTDLYCVLVHSVSISRAAECGIALVPLEEVIHKNFAVVLATLLSLVASSFSVPANGAQATSTAAPPAVVAPLPINREVIPLYLSERRMIVMARIGGSTPLPMVFDTGSSGNLIDLGIADRLNLPNTGPSPSIDGSTGKPVAGHDTFFKGVTLSGVAIADGRATAFNYVVPDEAGIIGPNSFPGKLVRLEGLRSRLVLLSKTKETLPTCKAFPYLGAKGDGLPSALVEIGTLNITAVLDSGNDSSFILPMDYIDKLALVAPPVQIGFAVSAGGKQPILSAHLDGTMKIGDATLDHPEIRFMAGGRPNVGLPILRKFTLVLDPSESRDWVLSADPTVGSCSPPAPKPKPDKA